MTLDGDVELNEGYFDFGGLISTDDYSITANQIFFGSEFSVTGGGSISLNGESWLDGRDAGSGFLILDHDTTLQNNDMFRQSGGLVGDDFFLVGIEFESNAVFRNSNTATFITRADADLGPYSDLSEVVFTAWGGGNLFENQGLFTKSGYGTTEIESGIAFANHGSVMIEEGRLRISGGDGGSTTGSFNVASGSSLLLEMGDFAFEGSAVFVNGEGTLEVVGNTVTFDLGTTLQVDHLRVDAGGLLEVETMAFSAQKIQLGANATFRLLRQTGESVTVESYYLDDDFNPAAPTEAKITLGEVLPPASVETSFTQNQGVEAGIVGDILTLDGLDGEVFVLELSLTTSDNGLLQLGWRNELGDWVNAILGNDGNNAEAQHQNFAGDFAAFQDIFTGSPNDYIGAYGYSATGAWAILNHNSDFALMQVPEPGTWALLIGGAGVLLFLRRRRQAV